MICQIILALSEGEYKDFLKDTDSWEEENKFHGKNRITARVVLKEMWKASHTFNIGFILYDDKCEDIYPHPVPIAVASAYTTHTVLHITYMASKRSGLGYGKKLLVEICKHANENGLALELTSVESARGFYDHIGMLPSPIIPGAFRFNRHDVIQFVENAEEFNTYGT